MNEENPALTQAPASSSPAPDSRPAPSRSPADSSGRGGPGLALAGVALVVAGVLGWQVFDLRDQAAQLRQEVAQRIAGSENGANEARAMLRQQQDAIAGLQGKLGALEAQVAATEGQAAALQSLYQEFSRSREDRVVAEVEQAVAMAAQQLAYAGNPEAALIALEGAEARLAAQDRGQLLPLRRALMHDIERLKASPQVDVGGIALKLEGLLEKVDALPLAFAGELAAKAAAGAGAAPGGEPSALDFIKGLALDVWREMLTLIRVERLDQSAPVLLAPEQTTFLRENLKIRLLTARLALLGRDGRTFAADVAQARSWIERFFDARDEGVKAVVVTLGELEKSPVQVEQPAPTESIAALRMLQTRASEPASTAAPAGPVDSAVGKPAGKH